MRVEQNILRLNHLLSLYNMTVDELVPLISIGLSKKITKEEIITPSINIDYLKRIDKIFNKGIHYYLDPKTPSVSKDASIFFRKERFDIELSLGARKIVNQFEELKISLSAIAELSDIKFDRTLPVFNIQNSPQQAANEVRQALYPIFLDDAKDFLKALISKLAEKNILVFEFVETWNQKEKANIDGFFLEPNVIVLKRHQKAFKREIFTLAHELAHYLLEEEDIEEVNYVTLVGKNLSSLEKWCNDFAYYFLCGKYDDVIQNLDVASPQNDYHADIVKQISEETHLSEIAIFTKLLFLNKISFANYSKVKAESDEKFRIKNEELKIQQELDEQNGINRGGSTPTPMKSPLLVSTIQTAFHEGIINEYEFCKKLNIKPDKITSYL